MSDVEHLAHISDIADKCTHVFAVLSLLCTSGLCLMVFSSRSRIARRFFVAESIAGLALCVSFTIAVYYDKKASAFYFPISAFIMSVALLATRLGTIGVISSKIQIVQKTCSQGRRRDRQRETLRLIAIVLSASMLPLTTFASWFTDRRSAPGCFLDQNNEMGLLRSGELPHGVGSTALTAVLVFLQVLVVATAGVEPVQKHDRRARLASQVLAANAVLIGALLFFPTLNSENLTPWVQSFSMAIHEGDWCSTLFVTVSMFFSIAGLFVLLMSAYRLPWGVEGEACSRQHALFIETVTLAIVPPMIVMALGRMQSEFKMTFLVNFVPQLTVLILPYFVHFRVP